MGQAAPQLDYTTVDTAVAAAPALVLRPSLPLAPEWVPVGELTADSPGPDDNARRQYGKRRYRSIRHESRGELAKRFFEGNRAVNKVHRDAVWHSGRTAGELYAARLAPPAPEPAAQPPGWDKADAKTRTRHLVAEQARRGLLVLITKMPLSKSHPLWKAEFGERLKASGVGRSLRTAQRLLAWNPAAELFVDGRRQRGKNADEGPALGAGWSDRFKGEFLHALVNVFRGQPGTVHAAYKIAAGLALQRGETPPSYNRALAWYNREVPEPLRGIFHDERKWQRSHVESVRRDYGTFRPMQVWSGDWHRCDFKVFRGGDVTRPSNWIRPWLCVWEDFASRVIVGWCLAVRPDTDGLLAAFGEGVMGYGGPLGVIIDNGKDFASKAFAGERGVIDEERIAGVCGALGVSASFCWPFNPGSKPPESWFRTFCLQVSKTLPTYCGGTPAGRPPELEARLKRGEIAPFTHQDAEGIIRRWIEEVYHVSPHSGDGMNRRCPLQAMEDNPLPKRTAPEHVLRIMLQKQVRATVTRRGVRYRDVYYNAYDQAGRCALLPLQGKEVMLLVPYRRDADASTIEVWTLTGEKICEAYNAALDGSSVEHVKEIRHRNNGAKRQVREAVAAMRVVSTPLTAQAMMDAQARYAAAQGGARLAAGAESQRDLQLLPGAASLIDQLPTPRSGGCGGRNAPAPLDACDMPAPRRVEWTDPLDAAAELEGGEESAEGSALDLDGVTFASAEPDHVETSPLDDLPWPMDAAGDTDGDGLPAMGDTDD